VRVCLVSAKFPPQRCGVGDYTAYLAGALAKIGHEVDVVTSKGDLDLTLYPSVPNVSVHRVVHTWGARGLPQLIRYIKRLDTTSLLIQYTPHSFDRRGIPFAVNLLPALLRAVYDIRVAANFHELYIPFGQTLKRDVGSAWQRAMALLMASTSNAVSVTAAEWQRRLRRMGINKHIELIPVGSNIPLATFNEEDRCQVRRRFFANEEGILVACFGASHDRDLKAVLHGLARLKREGPAKLVWIGGGDPDQERSSSIERAMVANGLTPNDVVWTGVLPHPEVSRMLNACDVMMLPFIDGVSTRRTSAVTAFQHGLPLLTTRGNEIEPWFVHGQSVFLVPIGDAKALGEGLAELGGSPELRDRLARGARKAYETYFAWDIIARHVIQMLQEWEGHEAQAVSTT